MKNSLDIVALGTCYVDTNAGNYPFTQNGIPVETELIGDSYETVPGGSAVNFCRLLQKLGIVSSFIGMAGNDVNGDTLERLLKKEGVKPYLIRKADLLTNISFNMTSQNGSHIMLVAGTANAALHPDVVLPKLKEIIRKGTIVYLGGCFKLKAFMKAFPSITVMAERQDAEIVVDHGRIPKSTSDEQIEAVKELVLHASYYFASRDEFCQLWDVAEITDGLQLLNERAPKLQVIVKDGKNGVFYRRNGEVHHVPATEVKSVVNVTGAGDTFNAGVISALVQGRSFADSVEYGCAVAAAKISNRELPVLT